MDTTTPIEVFPDPNNATEPKKDTIPTSSTFMGWVKENAKTVILVIVILLILYYVYITYYKGEGSTATEEDDETTKENPAAAKSSQLDHNFNIKETIGEIEQKTKDILKQVSVN
jgi:Tfp pilus assembly protein PilO